MLHWILGALFEACDLVFSDWLSLFACNVENGTEVQALFWNKRGFRGNAYDELVHFYDIRTHYPAEVVKEYGLRDPQALTV